MEDRRKFEAENSIATTSADSEVRDNYVSDETPAESMDEMNANENVVSGGERLELARQEREIVSLRVEIAAMKRREKLNALREEAEIARLTAEANANRTATDVTAVTAAARNLATAVSEQHATSWALNCEMADGLTASDGTTAPRQIIELPTGVRMTPYPPRSERAAIVLPTNDRRPDYRDCEVPKFSG